MARKPTLRDNFQRFAKNATINLTKGLQEEAERLQKDISKDIEKKLLETYKDNVIKSYTPRSEVGFKVAEYNAKRKQLEQEDRKKGIMNSRRGRKKLTYRHTNTFLNSIDTSNDGKTVKIIIRDVKYDDPTGINRSAPKSTVEVHDYLTKGTKGGGIYPYKKDGKTQYAPNYPTPAHLFEEHTQLQMNAYLDILKQDIESGRYLKEKRR